MKSRNVTWLESKIDALADWEQSRWRNGSNYYWRSKPNNAFEWAYHQCYIDGIKTARMITLDVLKAIGMTVWYCDVGCLVGRTCRNAALRVQCYKASANIIQEYYREIGMPCNISYVRGLPVITFTLQGTYQLMRVVSQVIPKCKHYLVPREFK